MNKDIAVAHAAKDIEPVAYLAWRDGKPCYECDDAVCEDAVWPDDHDDDRTSMPVYLHPAHDDTALLRQCLDALYADQHTSDWDDAVAALRNRLGEKRE